MFVPVSLLGAAAAAAAASAAAAPPAPFPDAAPVLWLLAGALVVAGIAGTVVPLLPGAPLVFLGLLVAARIDDFHKVGWVTLIFLALLTLLAYAVDLWATRHGARRVGASGWALLGAFLGGLAGLFFALPGLILGPFLAATSAKPAAPASAPGWASSFPPPAASPSSSSCWASSPSSTRSIPNGLCRMNR
jgi:uncharacterized protein YqgC (DUF456 family)